jgi:solute:Na+ symporter, SSS family
MNGLHEFFTLIDWAVVAAYLLLTTWVGHLMKGKQASIKDFFLGGRSLPWLAVTGSIIATEISGVTFVGVPASVMALKGDFTYLQWAIGSIIARIFVGFFFVKVFYEKDIYSPYDYMGIRLGKGTKSLATVFFTLGSILAQSVRVVVAALPLRVVTPLPFEWCIVVIGVFAIIWTLMGGMRTVIWTDVMQFLLFALGGTIALFWMVSGFENGWDTLFSMSRSATLPDGSVIDKMRFFNFDLGPELEFTFWVAMLAVPFQNLTAFGVDQLNAQRMFCCRSAADARKAIIVSSLGQLVTVLMLLVGAALFVFYKLNPPTDPIIIDGMKWQGGVPGDGNTAFPIWIVTEMPTGLKGLILAGIFAAAISSLDSILAALSQTTLSLFKRTHEDEGENEAEGHKRLVKLSRVLVVVWGVFLTGFAFLLYLANEKEGIKILPLAFGMTTYTVGPLLGMFLVALWGGRRGSFAGLLVGSMLSIGLVVFVRTDVWQLFMTNSLATWLAQLPTYRLVEGEFLSVTPTLASPWMWPITTLITVGFGLLGRRKILHKNL